MTVTYELLEELKSEVNDLKNEVNNLNNKEATK